MTDTNIANVAAQLVALLINEAQTLSDPAELAEAVRIHDEEHAYPRLTVSLPHGGGSIRLELTLCHPRTDAPLVRLFEGTAEATAPAWTH